MKNLNKLLYEKSFKSQKSAFSLMEMMIVLLIMSIVAAASAPMITKKLASSSGSNGSASPWISTGIAGNIVFNQRPRDISAIIGSARVPGVNYHPRLYVSAANGIPAIGFGIGNNQVADLNVGNGSITLNNTAANTQAGTNSVAIGIGQTLNSSTGVVAIGQNASIGANSNGAIAIGQSASASAQNAVAIGNGTTANTANTVFIGDNDSAYNLRVPNGTIFSSSNITSNGNVNGSNVAATNAVTGASVTATGNISSTGGNVTANGQVSGASVSATGNISSTGGNLTVYGNITAGGDDHVGFISGTHIEGSASVAGRSISSTNEVSAGTDVTAGQRVRVGNSTKYPINLYIDGDGNNGIVSATHITASKNIYSAEKVDIGGSITLTKFGGNGVISTSHVLATQLVSSEDGIRAKNIFTETLTYTSDKRLKDVKEKFTAGLAELKKIEPFNFTFKNDEKKTPRVGVMAQDLRKIFPNAVSEDEDGYLRIRQEDMFYAMINAIKELDSKITAAFETIKSNADEIHKLRDIVNQQQKTIEALEKRISKLEKAKK